MPKLTTTDIRFGYRPTLLIQKLRFLINCENLISTLQVKQKVSYLETKIGVSESTKKMGIDEYYWNGEVGDSKNGFS